MASGGSFGHVDIDTHDANLVAVYKLDEAETNNRVNSSTHASAPGDLVEQSGTVSAATGKDNDGADFEAGDTEYLQIASGDVSRNQAQFSGSCWIKLETLVNQYLIGESTSGNGAWSRFGIYLQATGSIQLQVRDKAQAAGTYLATSATGVISAGSWFHIAWMINTTTDELVVWVNGARKAVAVPSMGPLHDSAAAESLYVGVYNPASPSLYLDGIVDELYLWLDALTDAAVTALYNSATGRFWNTDTTAPGVPTNVSKLRLENPGNSETQTAVLGYVGTEADLAGVHIGRADDATASTPTHILDDDGDGTCSWIATGSSTDPLVIGGDGYDAPRLPAESDRWVGWADPDQSGSDDDRAYFLRTVDMVGNASAWVKGSDAVGAAPVQPAGVTVQDRNSDGDLTAAWTNGASYAAGDFMVAYKKSTNDILGCGDATAGSMTFFVGNNDTAIAVKLRAERTS